MFNLSEFFLHIVKLTYVELNQYLVESLQAFYKEEDITYHNENDKSFIYVKGSAPYLLVAHTDTVHKERPVDIFFTKKFNDPTYTTFASSQGIGGDDRSGIAIIFALLNTGLRPSLLFPSGEEIGTKGSIRFTELNPDLPNVNFILQFDRRNNTDVTRYADQNDSLIKEIIALGYTEVQGSFSDISILCPKYLVSGVNVSASFFNEHTPIESVDIRGMFRTVGLFTTFLQTDLVNTKHTYIPKTYLSTGYQQTYLFDDTDAFNARYIKYKPSNTLRTNSYVDNYEPKACFDCGLYADNLHPMAFNDGESFICDDCAIKDEQSFICPHCGDHNTIDSFTEVMFDFAKQELSVTCQSCFQINFADELLSKATIDSMMEILMLSYPKKGGKK